LVVLGATSVSCSSSSGGSSGAGTPSSGPSSGSGKAATEASFSKPSGSVRGFDGTTIKVASIGIKSQLPSIEFGSRARIDRFNKTNEVPGVKIDYLEFANDNVDRATALSESRRLVAQEQVFAIVGDSTAFNPGSYFEQQHVPYFGFAFDSTYCSDQPDPTIWGFGFDGCLIPDHPKTVGDSAANVYKYVAKKLAKPHPTIAIFSGDNQSGQNAALFDVPPYTGSGFDAVFAKGIIPSGTPVSDYTPYVQQLLHSDHGKAPDSMLCLVTTDCIPIYAQLQANHYAGVFISPLYSDVLLKPMKGSIVFTAFAPFGDDTPANAQLKADLKAVKPELAPDLGVAVGYFSTDMFIEALKAVVKAKGAAYISPENVQQAAANTTWEIKGQAGPTKYPDSTVNPTPLCSAVVYDDGTAWKTVEPYSCSSKTWPVPG
jgi:hypothetical protein